jgi:microcystin degradation protein MlrC
MVEIEHDATVPFVEGLENARCPECGATVEWVVDLDADGTTYAARHCGEEFYMVPETYRFVVESEREA